jgi:hypothetical protein
MPSQTNKGRAVQKDQHFLEEISDKTCIHLHGKTIAAVMKEEDEIVPSEDSNYT